MSSESKKHIAVLAVMIHKNGPKDCACAECVALRAAINALSNTVSDPVKATPTPQYQQNTGREI